MVNSPAVSTPTCTLNASFHAHTHPPSTYIPNSLLPTKQSLFTANPSQNLQHYHGFSSKCREMDAKPDPVSSDKDLGSSASSRATSNSSKRWFPFGNGYPSSIASSWLKAGLDIVRPMDMEIPSRGEEMDDGLGRNSGVYLTWKDLWVTVADKTAAEGVRRPILQGVTGYAEPSEVLAIMGPSGCGKSTLLDALAGRLDSNTTQKGDILINGRKQALAFGTSGWFP
ncbi:UNVERIFIED_CONTAM: ABC transporter G family member 15 [Sesamum radiatum]|uniref:ABC transporter G family member 15 n=1 Tax=Sesamum radiatum TaxID=300843 RepID=A0AAW2VQX3_SESRA